jgi:hypothetical protein
MELFDPTVSAERSAIRYAPRPRALQGLKVGLVENTKFNSEALLRRVARRLEAQHGMSLAHLAHKKSAGTAVSEAAIAELKAKADFVIAGVGD